MNYCGMPRVLKGNVDYPKVFINKDTHPVFRKEHKHLFAVCQGRKI